MVGQKRRDIPAPRVRGRDRFDAWRRTRKVGTRISERLWTLAVKLAAAHGLNRTAATIDVAVAAAELTRTQILAESLVLTIATANNLRGTSADALLGR